MKSSDMNHSMVIESYGVPVRLASTSVELFSALAPLLDANLPGWKVAKQGSHAEHEFQYRWNASSLDSVYKDGSRLDVRRKRDSALAMLASQIRMCIAEFAPNHIFIHAGVVCVDGVGVILPARSMHGKTTLTAELVRQGAVYYSDEYAVVGMDSRVYPFPKALSMRGILEGRAQVDIPVEDFGGKQGKKPVRVGLVVITEFKERSRWRPKQLSVGEAFLEVINHTVPIRRNTAVVIPTLTKLLQDAVIVKTFRGEAPQAAEAIIDLARAIRT
jgi:hypothetical protein